MKTPFELVRSAEKFVIANSPVILTAVGVTGVVATAYLTGKATIKAQRVLDREIAVDRTFKKDFELVWKLYIPAVGVGTLTCASIIFANRIESRRAAALAAMFTISERLHDEYKEKVVEKMGVNKEKKIREEVARDQVIKTKTGQLAVLPGKVLCYDPLTDRTFISSMETIRAAVNDINHQLRGHDYATLGEFYEKIGLKSTPWAGQVGWHIDQPLRMEFSTVLTEEGQPCLAMDFETMPSADYYRFH